MFTINQKNQFQCVFCIFAQHKQNNVIQQNQLLYDKVK